MLDDQSDEKLSEALREKVGLLQPKQIRQNREALRLTQKELASHLRVADATLARWETGGQIQPGSIDALLRSYFAFPEVRKALAEEGTLATLGTNIVSDELALASSLSNPK